MRCVYLYACIRVIGLQYNKKINFDVHNKQKIILLEETCFPFAISVFSKWFEIKHSQNLLGSKYDSITVTFNSCTDMRQISAAPNSRRYLILLIPLWKMLSFETNWLRFLVRNRAAFCLIRILPQMQCGMVCWRDTIVPRQRDSGYAMILFYENWFFDSNSSFS